MLIAAAGPPPYDVETVMRWSIGSVTVVGALLTLTLRWGILRQRAAPAGPPPAGRLAFVSVVEGLLFIAALYLLQIPLSAGTGMLVGLLAFILAGSGIANGLALRAGPATSRSRHLGWTLLVTLIYPVTQALVALTLGPPLNRWFARLFP